MKLSRYNLIRNYEGTLVFFNAVTCALAVVDENFMRVIEDIKNGAYDEKNYDTELIAAMKESGILSQPFKIRCYTFGIDHCSDA